MFIGKCKCLLDGDVIICQQFAAYIHAWLESSNQNQDGVCPSIGGQINNVLHFLLFLCNVCTLFTYKMLKYYFGYITINNGDMAGTYLD